MSSDSKISVHQASQLVKKLESCGWTANDIRLLGQLPIHRLESLRVFELGGVPNPQFVNLHTPCKMPSNDCVRVLCSTRRSMVKIAGTHGSVVVSDRLVLAIDFSRKEQEMTLDELVEKYTDEGVPAQVLEYLQRNPDLWPYEWGWGGKKILFWGDVFKDKDGDMFVWSGQSYLSDKKPGAKKSIRMTPVKISRFGWDRSEYCSAVYAL